MPAATKRSRAFALLVPALLGLGFGASVAAMFWVTPFYMEPREAPLLWLFARVFCLLAAWGFLLGALLRARRRLVRAVPLVLSAVTLCALFLALETFFMFHAQSFGNSRPLVEKNWFRAYWKPVNRLGYRDAEVPFKPHAGERSVLFAGDSFVAGHGVRDPGDRVTELLAKELGPGVRVYNLGVPGADTRQELENLEAFPLPPDLIILGHYENDIDDVIPKAAEKDEVPAGPVREFIVRGSFFLDWLSAMGILGPHGQPAYIERTDRCQLYYYLRPEKLNEHLTILDGVAAYARQRKVPLVVVLYCPMNHYIALSEWVANRPVAEHLRKEGVPVLEVYDLIRGLPAGRRKAGFMDNHPGPEVNRIVARALARLVAERNLLPKKGESP